MKKSAQRKNKKVAFRASILAVALASGFAHAAETQSQNLETVTVKAQAVTSTHRVSTKKLDESTSTDLKDVLFNEPSVSAGGGNGTSQWWTIRGMGQDQIDMKVDNTYSDTQLFHHNGRFLLDPALTKIVAVQKGTGSASAGIGATSGAIVAKTVDAKDLLREGQNVGFKVNAGYSSNKGYSRGAAVYGRYGNLDALIAGNWVTEKDYKAGKGYAAMDGSNVVKNSALGQRGLLAKFSYDLNENNRVTLSHRQEQTHGKRALREEFDFSQNWVSALDRNGNVNISAAQKAAGYTADAQGNLLDPNGNKIVNTSNNNPRYRVLTHDTTNLEYEGNNLGALGSLKANVYHMKQKREEEGNNKIAVKTNGANIGFDTPIFDKHTIKYGINYREQKSYPNTLSTGATNQKKTDTGVYVEGIWDFAPVTVTTGVRYDHFNVNFSDGKKVKDGAVSPSLGLIYDVNKDLSLNASYNMATRSPRLSEVLLSGAATTTASDDLKAERSRNAEIGFKYKLNNNLDIDGSYFWQTIKDVQATRTKTINKVDFTENYNGGTLKNQGYELNTAYRWNGLTARAGVAYNKPKTNNTNLDTLVTTVPVGRTWTAGLAYQLPNPNLEIGWRGRFVQHTNYSASNKGAGGGTERPGYGVNDIYVNWKPTGKDDLNVNFAVNNVGDKYYKPHSQRESTSGNSLPETGRDFRVNVNYRF